MANNKNARDSQEQPAGAAYGGIPIPRQDNTQDFGRSAGDDYGKKGAGRWLGIGQKVIIGLIVCICALLVYRLIQDSRHKTQDPGFQTQDTRLKTQAIHITETKTQNQNSGIGIGIGSVGEDTDAQPLSLQTAYNFEGQNNFAQALEVFQQLAKKMPKADAKDERLADFLRFKSAMCLKKLMREDEAESILRSLAASSSAAIRCLTAYNSIAGQLQKKQYLAAMANVYRCLCQLELLNLEQKQSANLTARCHFLAAQCLTQNILNLGGGFEKVPDELWIKQTWFDPFTSPNQGQIETLLESGNSVLDRAILSPVIEKVQDSQNTPERWKVACYKATVEELLSRFATQAKLELKWNLGDSSQQANIRSRIVTLNLTFATARQVAEKAAGSRGCSHLCRITV